MMRLARSRGARHHDLWGVAPPDAGPEHPWHGVGLFKKGFGGREVHWAGSWDLVVDPTLYRLRAATGIARGWLRAIAPMSRGLGALTDVIGPERVVGIPVGEVTSLAYDSRRVTPGTLFFAVPGVHVDGHDFATEAIANGAVGLVVERELADASVPQLVVANSRHALADAADDWFGRPSEYLTVIGVTGTDGKSTVTALAAEMLWACRRHPGQIGTVQIGVGDDIVPNEERTTTPEALELQELLARMVEAGNDSVVMEATSHALALGRTRNCRFDVGVVTTVTSEHLEFHGTVEEYRAAKARLVEQAPIAVLNADDASFGYFHARARGPGHHLRHR